ncbi:MarR family transcriptional regulator [Micromonospora sp. WMMD980]|uniref:MarR family transcriptional regulator n=1 Tax=Micromonospora sp. WMMD980 TaxID=3016088 RepID=UPI0024177798|nr:MarR family transcriptional regulator [Micromonospora sp. WMMD980]MDG4803654.1 MarR family transcriptional regulator [Micromonospora sp. WMMD980]
MTDAPEPTAPHAMFKVLAALAELGEDTAAAVADKAGLAYSTATAKLRAWETTGQAERVHTDSKRAVWRLTDAGHATVGAASAAPPPTRDSDTPSPADRPTDATGADASADSAPRETPLAGEVEHADVDDTSLTPPAPPADPPPTVDRPPAPDEEEPAPGASRIATDPAGDTDDQTPATDPAAPPEADTQPSNASGGHPRRAKGSLRAAVLDVLEARPDQAFKTGELCRLIDAANAGTDARKASPGAVANAADKLVIAGKAIRTDDKYATFQLATTP